MSFLWMGPECTELTQHSSYHTDLTRGLHGARLQSLEQPCLLTVRKACYLFICSVLTRV